MSKKYSPVKIVNPKSKDHTVRLLAGQKLNLVFDQKEFIDYKLDIKSSFLNVEEVSEIPNGWMAVIAQETVPQNDDNTLFLGEVKLYGSTNQINASLCVLSKHQNNDFLCVYNPKDQTCVLEPNQVLDVIFQTKDFSKVQAYLSVADLGLELLQYSLRSPRKPGKDKLLVEHFFRFRFTAESIQHLSEQPYGKYQGGSIKFLCPNSDISVLKIVCAWKGKNSIYKALLLPRLPVCDVHPFYRKTKKQALQSDVTVRKIIGSDLESGCNVVLAKGIL